MEANLRIYVVLLVIFCQVLSIESGQKHKYKIVKTTKGLIRGQQEVTLLENKSYYSFKGIRYAQPPLDDLRFRPPISPTSWKGVLDTLEYGSECVQIKQIFRLNASAPYITGDEDCLFLNVFIPAGVTEKLPVLFWIHGGGFNEGTGNFYGPDFIINEHIILVTINYRVGPFGFLTLGTRRYSGNMGLKDQLLALKWVNENIESFGGDKKRITVAGQSAGAASTHFLTVSKASEYLFQRSIIMSGSILNMWAASEVKDDTAQMFELAQDTDPSVNTMDDLVQYLLNVDAYYLVNNTAFSLVNLFSTQRRLLPRFAFEPVVESNKNYYNMLLNINLSITAPYDDNYYLIETGDTLLRNKAFESTSDTMFGFTNKEVYPYFGQQINDPTLLEPFNEKFEVQLPLNYDDEIKYNTKIYQSISKEIHDSYFGVGVPVNGQTLTQYIDLMSDIWIRYAVLLSAKIQASVSSGKTYFYEFSLSNHLNIFSALGNVTLPGAGHGDELCYLFKCNVPNLYDTLSSVEVTAIKNMATLWTNFVRNGDPTIKDMIKPIGKHKVNYFNVTNNGVEIGVNPHGKAMALWDDIYGEYYKGFLSTNILNG